MAKRDLSPGATVFSDGLGCFSAVAENGRAHIPTFLPSNSGGLYGSSPSIGGASGSSA